MSYDYLYQVKRCTSENDLYRFKQLTHLEHANVPENIGWTAIHYVCCNGYNYRDNADFVWWLVTQRFANIDTRTKHGTTALHIAASGGLFSIGKVLLELGASVKTDNIGWSPFDHIALRLNRYTLFFDINTSMLQFAWDLLERGAKYSCCVKGISDRMVRARSNVRSAAVALIGIKKYRCSIFLNCNDTNIVKYLARLLWKSQRLQDNNEHLVWE